MNRGVGLVYGSSSMSPPLESSPIEMRCDPVKFRPPSFQASPPSGEDSGIARRGPRDPERQAGAHRTTDLVGLRRASPACVFHAFSVSAEPVPFMDSTDAPCQRRSANMLSPSPLGNGRRGRGEEGPVSVRERGTPLPPSPRLRRAGLRSLPPLRCRRGRGEPVRILHFSGRRPRTHDRRRRAPPFG